MPPLSNANAGGEHYAPLEVEGDTDGFDSNNDRPTLEEKGKGRYTGSDGEETGQETVEEGNDSEAEEKGLLGSERVVAPPRTGSLSASRKPLSPFQGKEGFMDRVVGTLTHAIGGGAHVVFAKEMASQTFPILLLSLMGSLLTGLLLERLQNWRVFIRIEELFILVPILLNLKGNLEMNLAARFSTSANIGELDLRATRRSLILGNLALLQVQALLVSLLSGLLAFILGMMSRNGIHHALQHPIHNPTKSPNVIAGGTIITDAMRGGYFEALLVLYNVATPLASALGDLLTLTILGVLSSVFARLIGTLVSTAVFILLLVSVGVNIVVTFRNAYVQELLSVGWGPLFIAMSISSGTGLVLENYVNEFDGFALFAPVLTALAGNAGSIFVSRISTALHSSRKEHYFMVASTLFCITTPVLFLFLLFVWLTGQAPVSFVFAVAFMIVVCIELALSLLLAYHLSFLLWNKDYDPDVYALPLLSSFLDVSGQLMLVGAFSVARFFAKKAVQTVVDTGQTIGGL